MTLVRELRLGTQLGIADTLTAFYVSPSDEAVFLAFAKSGPAEWPNQSYLTRVTGAFWESDDPTINVCKIVTSPMCCFTGIAEDPLTTDLWLVGFALDKHDCLGSCRAELSPTQGSLHGELVPNGPAKRWPGRLASAPIGAKIVV
ncbi:MAG: hypothetical protein JW993_06515 [Sedimentisphaerales bacterium]|nr:hypothetical protein [Sedimentisphaerales bacterium]